MDEVVEWSPHEGTAVLIKGGGVQSSPPLPREDTLSVNQAVSGPSPDSECAGTSTSDFSASRTVRGKSVSFKPQSLGVLLCQPTLTKMLSQNCLPRPVCFNPWCALSFSVDLSIRAFVTVVILCLWDSSIKPLSPLICKP